MNRLLKLLLGLCVAMSAQAGALTIDSITVSTVFGYTEGYTPGDFNRFGLLGVPFEYHLSDGRALQPGAGWIPYTNGTVASERVSGNRIEYVFRPITNWARGEGVLFYHFGQVWDGSGAEDLWSEGELVPVGPVVLSARIGSAKAVLQGLARVSYNNPASGTIETFVPYAKPEGSVVPYLAVYTLQEGRTWQAGIFDTAFSYRMKGRIVFRATPGRSDATAR